MTPQELYRNGRLREAITALGDELRKNPLDAKRRTFLFELLLFAGEYDRAEKQLEVLPGAGADAGCRHAALSQCAPRGADPAGHVRTESDPSLGVQGADGWPV